FSSTRRHTRSKRDWSSDVCSSDLELLPWSFIELGTRKVHGRLIAIGGNARPGNVHRGGVENGDYAGDARCVERFPALACGLIVRGQRAGDIGGRTGEIEIGRAHV